VTLPAGRIAEYALDLIFPPRCMICLDIIPLDKPKWRCAECDGLLEPIVNPCSRCGAPSAGGLCAECAGRPPLEYIRCNRSMYVYDAAAQRMIHNFKYNHHPEIARGLGTLVLNGGRLEYLRDADLIAYVPLHRKRLVKRGFNQAELFAKEISAAAGLPLTHALRRERDTAPQFGFDYVSRHENIAGAFAADGRLEIKNKRVIVIDDVCTTGATLNACAEVLMKNGAARVTAFTIAVAVKEI